MRYTATTTTCVVLTTIILAIITGPPTTVSAAEYTHPSVLFEKGIYEEQTKGDIPAAISIYQQIVDDAHANRKYIAKAHYRMGMCYIKKDQPKQAIKAFDLVIKNFPGQSDLVTEATQRRNEILANMGLDEVSHIVEQVVTIISNSSETDPQIKQALSTLDGLNQQTVVNKTITFLSYKEPTIRRAAIYILWKGPFDDITPAYDQLLKLSSHEEDLTRGMAAIVLGQYKFDNAYDTLTDMTLNDASPYARRCAAYSLAQLGNPKAKDVLNKALKDEDALVRANVQFALKTLNKNVIDNMKPAIVNTNPLTLSNDVDPEIEMLTVTFNQPMTDGSWSWTGGGDTFPESAGKIHYDKSKTTCNMPVKLKPGKVYQFGINSPSYKNFRTKTGKPMPWHIVLFATRAEDGTPTDIDPQQIEKVKRINAAALRGTPKILSTWPKPLTKNVPASLDKLTVTFNQPMMDRSWSWTGGGETYPETTDKPFYNEEKTVCTLPVKLEPGKVYWVGINSPSYRNFQNAAYASPKWYIILFATADENGKPTRIPSDMLSRARKINAASKSAK